MGLLRKLLNLRPGPDEFAEMMMRRFAEAGIVNLEYSAQSFSLQRQGTSHTIFLNNVYQNYCDAARARKKEVLNRFVTGFASHPEIPDDFAAAAPNLMPVIRDYRHMPLSALALYARDGTRMPPVPELQFASELNVGIAYDGEHTIQYPKSETIEKWGVGLEEIAGLAKNNLRDRTDPKAFREVANGVYAGQWGDSYESARMVLPDYFYRLTLSGAPVAFPASRNTLLVTGSYDVEALTLMLRYGEDAHLNQGYALSPNLYILQEGKWEMFVPESDGHRKAMRALQKRREAMDYGEQERCLTQIYEREKNDVYVVKCNLYKREDGSHFTLAIWSNGVNSLLPRTDEVALLVNPRAKDDTPKDVLRIPWSLVEEKLGGLLEQEDGLIPVRYRTKQFPDMALIEALRKLVPASTE